MINHLGLDNRCTWEIHQLRKLHKLQKEPFSVLLLTEDIVASIRISPNGEFNVDEGNNLCYSREEIWG